MVEVDVLDSRRLTGANIHTRAPGAVLELRVESGVDVDALIERWRAALAEGLGALGWDAREHVRRFVDERGRVGLELMFTAAVDRLYAATELNEWALARALGEEQGGALEGIREAAAAEQAAREGATSLIAAAEQRGIMALIDDEQLSLGQYADARTWPVAALPRPEAVDWSRFRRRPLALITGTNGKTTTTRLLARMLRLQGLRVGNTSTDGLFVDERLVEAGDWTGPGGARAIVRNPGIDVALLEAARGGLLRRGVGVPWADVAVITNIARDHLGEFGIFDLAGMAMAKGVVASVVVPGGRVVLGADSPALVDWARSRALAAAIAWFSPDPGNPVLADAREAWTVVDGQVARRCEGELSTLGSVAAMPLSLGGRARHNVANALAAAAAARGLGVPDSIIAAALREFGSRPEDNPGRARVWRVVHDHREVRVLVDFAHNHAGLAAIAELVRGYGSAPALCFGMAGDRSDEDLRSLGAALLQFGPRRVILREQPAYLRGRELGVVPRLLAQGLREAGFDPARISLAADEPSSIEQALAAGDSLIVLLVHTEREAVARWLADRGARLEQS